MPDTDTINRQRRRFITAAVMTAAAPLAAIGAGKAGSVELPKVKPGTNTSFRTLRQIDAGDLSIGYAEDGPAEGKPVLLLHGWPYDIHMYVDVAPLLASAGYRVIVPYLRGYGATRFLSPQTPRNGQQAALAADIVAFMDALKSSGRSSAAAIGAPGPRISSRRCGPSAARAWCRSAAI